MDIKKCLSNNYGNSAIVVIIVVALIAIGGYVFLSQSTSETPAEPNRQNTAQEDTETSKRMMEAPPQDDAGMIVMEKEMLEEMIDDGFVEEGFAYSIAGTLFDVTDGKSIRGTQTSAQSSGIAEAGYDDVYRMRASFEELPDPEGTDFYEGWIVRKNPFSVISTGVVTKIDEQYHNVYESSSNLLDHDFYVLTLEPDDGDPAPADHIVEGTME